MIYTQQSETYRLYPHTACKFRSVAYLSHCLDLTSPRHTMQLRLWNTLPHVVTSATILAVFQNRFKTLKNNSTVHSFVLALTDAYMPFSGLAFLSAQRVA